MLGVGLAFFQVRLVPDKGTDNDGEAREFASEALMALASEGSGGREPRDGDTGRELRPGNDDDLDRGEDMGLDARLSSSHIGGCRGKESFLLKNAAFVVVPGLFRGEEKRPGFGGEWMSSVDIRDNCGASSRVEGEFGMGVEPSPGV